MIALAVVAGLPLLVLALVAGFRNPIRVLLAAYAFTLPLGSGITIPVALPAPFNTVSSLAGMVVLAGLLAHLVLGRTSAPQILPAVPAWLMFAAFAGLSIAWSVDPQETAKGFLLLVSLLAVYIAALLVRVEASDVTRFEEAVVAGGAVAGLYAIVLLVGSGLQLTRRDIPRYAVAGGVGEGTDPNITAATLILPLAIAVTRAFRARSPGARAAFGLAATVIGVGIVLTGSRGGMIAALISVLAAVMNQERRRAALAVLLAVATVLGATLAVAPDALRRRVNRTTSSGRTDIWRTGLEACETYCWAGGGWASFPTVYQRTLHTTPNVKGRDRPFVAHNIWISAAVETGVAGLLLLVLALGLVARDLFRLAREVRGPPLAALAGIMAASIFLSTLTFKYFWLVMIYAGLVALTHAPKPSPALRPAWRSSLEVAHP